MELEERVKGLPDASGVYVMKNAQGQVIYVGKARSLKNRVRSYFHGSVPLHPKTRALVSRVTDLDYIITHTEIEALILENNLIKEHRPRYNVVLRDDKNYPCLKLTVQEKFPCLYIVRGIKKDDSLYFGPFTSALALRETLRVIYKVFGLRRCPNSELKRGRACLYFQIKQCLAPCLGLVSDDSYKEVVRQIVEFLQGKGQDLIARIKKEMIEESEVLNFERAAVLRDQIRSLERVLAKQRMVSTTFLDQDFIGLHMEGGVAQVEVLFVRGGKLIGNQSLSLSNRQGLGPKEILNSFIAQFYGAPRFIPQEIIIPVSLEDGDAITAWLAEKRSRAVKLVVAQRGDRARILQMAEANAENAAREKLHSRRYSQDALEELKAWLKLHRTPRRIECFDISNIMGKNPVASMAVFVEGALSKRDYRRYKIRSLESPNDFAMMQEVLTRRFNRALEEGSELPDLLMVDGGKGQLSVALQVLKELNVQGVDAIGLAKAQEERGEDEKLYLPNVKDAVRLPPGSSGMFLLQRVRDEAHRFAITFHRKLRLKGALRSALEEIPGIGISKRKALLSHFGSLKRVMAASLEDLKQAPKITSRNAETIFKALHS